MSLAVDSTFHRAAAEPTVVTTVVMRRDLADGVVELTLRPVDGRPLPAWEPGAHVDLATPVGPRQYSLCGGDAGHWRVAVLHEPAGRGGSTWVHTLRPGASVEVRGPRNHFALGSHPRYLFVMGGIGITPILPMIAAVDGAGAAWQLVYGGRRRSSMAYLDDLPFTEPPDGGDAAAPDRRVSVRPQDEYGLLDLDALFAATTPDTAVYCCGPEPLLAAVEARWTGPLHVERFTAVDLDDPTSGFEVELARSGLTLGVAHDRSILDVVEEAGVSVSSSCSEGTCGTCETPVLDGAVDHRDAVLTEAERAAGDYMMICVSRAACARLVLDL